MSKRPYDMPPGFEEALAALPNIDAVLLVMNDGIQVSLGEAYRVDLALLAMVALAATSVGGAKNSAKRHGIEPFQSFDPNSLRLMQESLKVLNEAFPTTETTK